MSPRKRKDNKGHHHYVFVHMALRDICQNNPQAFFNTMMSPSKDQFMQIIWKHVRQHCDGEGDSPFDIEEVNITACRLKNFPALIVAMPPPFEPAEAHFACIVLNIDLSSDSVSLTPNHPKFWFFTLEKGINQIDGSDITYLCGWSEEGSHHNYCEGPAANEAAFVHAVMDMI
ncbi:MAG: hypothetical protein AB4352_01505 [Hormoscilla sp.]